VVDGGVVFGGEQGVQADDVDEGQGLKGEDERRG
jgi:hypothetical protein